MPYFPQLTTDLDNIQKLDDLPNQTGGLSAAELKAKFDKAGDDIKAYINSTLLAALEATTASASGAGGIGIEALVSLPGVTNVMDAIDAIMTAMANVQAGTVIAGSVGTTELADGGVTTAKLDDEAVTTAKIDDGAVTGAKCDFSAGLTVAGDLTQQGVIILDSDSYGTTLPVSPVAGQLFFKKV